MFRCTLTVINNSSIVHKHAITRDSGEKKAADKESKELHFTGDGRRLVTRAMPHKHAQYEIIFIATVNFWH